MRTFLCVPLALAALLSAAPARAQAPKPRPLLRLEAGGPTSRVTALAFGTKDGRLHLYAAGFDKVVRAWAMPKGGAAFEPQPVAHYRVPIGPGLSGALNALALSEDGTLLAVGGSMVVSGGVALDGMGIFLGKTRPTLKEASDEGLVYVFETGTGKLRATLRGHTGAVHALAFAEGGRRKTPFLVSLARVGDKDDGGELCAWELTPGKEGLHSRKAGFAFKADSPPGLAAWQPAGGAAPRAAVVLGLNEGKLHVWEAQPGGGTLTSVPNGRLTVAVAAFPGGKRILTGSLDEWKGQWSGWLTTWDVTGAKPKQGPSKSVTSGQAGIFSVPLRVALLAGDPDRTAVVVQSFDAADKNRTYSLELRTLKKDGVSDRKTDLWGGSTVAPVLAAASDGSLVAVAGRADHRILVYRVGEGFTKVQELAGAGVAANFVQFARRKKKADEIGLILADGPNEADKFTLGFSDLSVTAGTTGWTADVPKTAGWKVTPGRRKDGATVLRVSQDGDEKFAFTFPAGQPVADYLVVPPVKGRDVPLLVVASYARALGTPLLEVYALAEGRPPVVQFTGHSGRIAKLALSADGRLLASASEDRTVCVWGLTALGEIAGKVGGLPDLGVNLDAKGRLVVVTPSAGVAKGMVIEGVVQGGKARALASPIELYEALWVRSPGAKVTLRVRDEAGAAKDVTVTLGQGKGDRTPLLLVFATRPEKGKPRGWVGWSPRGYFESSRPDVEGVLGWHFNTGKAEEPTAFANIKAYRDKGGDKEGKGFYRKGFLGKLLALEDTEQAVAAVNAPPPPRPLPVLNLKVVADGKPVAADEHNDHLVRAPKVQLQLFAEKYEQREGDRVEWQLGDGKARAFDEPVGGVWSAAVDLPKFGGYTLRATVVLTGEKEIIVPSRALRVRYQAPAPQLAYEGKSRLTAKEAEKGFPFKLSVGHNVPGTKVVVTVEQMVKGKAVRKDFPVVVKKAPEVVEAALTLEVGANQITVQARNADPVTEPPGVAALETTMLPVSLFVEKPAVKVARPAIALEWAALAKAGPRAAHKLRPGEHVGVDLPRLRLTGTVSAEQPLTEATWEYGAGQKGKIALSKDGKSGTVALDLDLEPGKSTLRVHAKTADSEPADVGVPVVYLPRLPQVVFAAPAPGWVVYEEKQQDARTIELHGKVRWPADSYGKPFPITPTLVVNDAKMPAGAVAIEKDVLTAKGVPLRPGQNHVRLFLSHPPEWGGKPRSDDFANVMYLRPPQVREWTKAVGRKPEADLTAEVSTPLPLLRDKVQVTIDGRVLDQLKFDLQEVKKPKKGWAVWAVKLHRVPLKMPAKAGDKVVTKVGLVVGNEEAVTLEPAEVEIAYARAAPAKIAVLTPSSDFRKVADPEVRVRFRVFSTAEVTAARVWRGDKEYRAAAVKGPAAPDVYDYEAKVPLDWDENALRVEAENEGGRVEERFTVTAVRPPVEVRIDAVELADGTKLQGKVTAGGAVFGAADGPAAYVHGTVRWVYENAAELQDRTQRVRLHVNGFQQELAELLPPAPGALERTFKAKVVLTKKQGNLVRVEAPGLVMRDEDRRDFAIDCRRPGGLPEFHVVVVAPGERDGEALQTQLRVALAKATGRNDLVHVYDVLGPRSDPDDVTGQLVTIHEAIREQAQRRPDVQPVVVVYYRGTETGGRDAHWLWMPGAEDGGPTARTALRVPRWNQIFSRFLGAQLVLLDVRPPSWKGAAGGGSAAAPLDYPFAVMRQRWLGKAGDKVEGQLLEAVKERLPRAGELHELTGELLAQFRKLEASGARTRYDQHLPADLYIRFRP